MLRYGLQYLGKDVLQNSYPKSSYLECFGRKKNGYYQFLCFWDGQTQKPHPAGYNFMHFDPKLPSTVITGDIDRIPCPSWKMRIYVYICVFVCMYVCVFVCIYVCVYVWKMLL